MKSDGVHPQRESSMPPAQWLLRLLQGALIGVGAILPGVSGGVLCVLFGIYQPMMALLAHPIASFKAHFQLFIPVILGAGIGFFGLARLVSALFAASETLAVCLFIGLILGMLPSLFREAGEKGRNPASYIMLAGSFLAFFFLFSFLQGGAVASITPSVPWYFLCGVVWGLSLVIPGLSSSSILIFLGLYQPMTQGVGSLDLAVILPVAGGVLASALLLARLVNHLFEKYYHLCYHFILGVVLASTLVIVPRSFTGDSQLLSGAALGLLGFLAAWAMDLWGRRIKESGHIKR